MQEGHTKQSRLDFFKGKGQDSLTWSKIVQTKDQEVVLVGGLWESLLAHSYDVGRSCLKVDLSCATVAEKSPMATGRSSHGAALICNFVYAIAGWFNRSCERYNVGADAWSPLPEFPDKWTAGVSLVVT